MSEQTRRKQAAAAGGSRKGGKKPPGPESAAAQNKHILMPDLNLGADDDDDDDDDDNRAFLASFNARKSKSPEPPAAAIPPQAESEPTPATAVKPESSVEPEGSADTSVPPVVAAPPAGAGTPDGGEGNSGKAGPSQPPVAQPEQPPAAAAMHQVKEDAEAAPPGGPAESDLSVEPEGSADTSVPPVVAAPPAGAGTPDGGEDNSGKAAPSQPPVAQPEQPPAAAAMHQVKEDAEAAPPGGPVSGTVAPSPVQGGVSGFAIGTAAPRRDSIQPAQTAQTAQSAGAALARSSAAEAGRAGTTGSAAEIYGGSGSGAPARRPGRRRHREPYSPEQPRDNAAAMQEMVERAPRYAALLHVYSAAQLKKEPFKSRNLHLYGLTADDAGLQSVADKAFLKTLTTQEPRVNIGHYADAALQPVLAPFNPEGIDREAMEDERDYLWDLAQRALEYRRYILSEPEASRMPKYRAKVMLRAHVDDRFSRMLNLMDSFAGIEAKPFEIVSWVLADYLRKLPEEQAPLKDVFSKHVTTGTIQ